MTTSTTTKKDARTSTKIDPSKPWRLSHILEGHTSDVKSLTVLRIAEHQAEGRQEAFQSASRDETVRTWMRPTPKPGPGNRPPSSWYERSTLRGKRFQNSVTFVDDEDESTLGLSMMGGLDARILVFRLPLLFPEEGIPTKASTDEPVQILLDHHDNVCHLSVSGPERTPDGAPFLLISASWDCTSRVWRLESDLKHGSLWKPLHLLKGHQAAVWAAEVVSAKPGEERYLTASADLFIRMWEAQEIKKVYAGHKDVVRGIVLLPPKEIKEEEASSAQPAFYDKEDLFATCSNDGSVRIWSLDDRRSPAHTPTNGGEALRVLLPKEEDGTVAANLLYDIRYAGTVEETGERLILACGEGGQVHIWNIDSGERISHIAQPVMSAWSLEYFPFSGDIATADSDGKVRIYTQRKYNTSFMAQEHRLEKRSRNVMVEVGREELEEHDRKCREIEQSRQRQVRAEVVAHETEGTQTSSDQMYNGQRYDAVLKIDVSDDAEPLSLALNRGDDPRAKAKEFIAEHKLSEQFEDDIVAFINQVGPK